MTERARRAKGKISRCLLEIPETRKRQEESEMSKFHLLLPSISPWHPRAGKETVGSDLISQWCPCLWQWPLHPLHSLAQSWQSSWAIHSQWPLHPPKKQPRKDTEASQGKTSENKVTHYSLMPAGGNSIEQKRYSATCLVPGL